MDQVFIRLHQNTSPLYFLSHPPLPSNLDDSASSSSTSSGGGFDLNKKISPSILLIIIILAIIFFISGLLHLLVRFLLRPPNRDPDEVENVTALQGQLQQLFHLHDSGVDQSFIDTLPVFDYKSIIGLKDPFDCAVCLCEFEAMDKLRLLPKCSHAFHMDCIDTWLLSHSTCPLCRASLLPDFPPPNSTLSPIVLVLESGGSESSREIVNDGEFNDIVRTNSSSVLTTNSHLGFHGDTELGSSRVEISQKSCEILAKDDIFPAFVAGSGEKVVAVKLGKFRNVDIGEGSSNNNSFDSRRCYSMGSFEYVMDENSSLKVPIRTPMKKQSSKKHSLPLKPGHRPAMSECDCESRRGFFPGIEFITSIDAKESSGIVQSSNANAIGRSKRESFSISKIWLRGKRGKQPTTEDSSRRAVSFRYPVNENSVPGHGDPKVNNGNVGERRSNSEMSIGRWRNGGSEMGCDEENQRYNSMDFQAKTPSFARRTLLWLVGKQNKVVNVHTSFAPNV